MGIISTQLRYLCKSEYIRRKLLHGELFLRALHFALLTKATAPVAPKSDADTTIHILRTAPTIGLGGPAIYANGAEVPIDPSCCCHSHSISFCLRNSMPPRWRYLPCLICWIRLKAESWYPRCSSCHLNPSICQRTMPHLLLLPMNLNSQWTLLLPMLCQMAWWVSFTPKST